MQDNAAQLSSSVTPVLSKSHHTDQLIVVEGLLYPCHLKWEGHSIQLVWRSIGEPVHGSALKC